MKKSLSLMLAMLMLLSSVSLTACSENSAQQTESTETTNEPVQTEASDVVVDETLLIDDDARPKHSLPETLSFDGASFNVAYPDWQGYSYYFFADEQTGDAMNDAAFARKIHVEDYLNVKLTQEDVGYIDDVVASVKKVVQAGDDYYQLALLHCISGVSDLASGGYLYNFDNLEYVDYSAPWWNREMMDVLKLGNRTVYGVSDYMIPCPYVMFFNKTMVETNSLQNPYELVYNGEWTIDSMFALAQSAIMDVNGDGVFKDGDDVFGMSCDEDSKYISFMTGAGQFLTSRDENNHIQLDVNTERMISIIDKFYQGTSVEGMIGKQYGENGTALQDAFGANKMLYCLDDLASAVKYRDLDIDIGILPYPKFDSAQENYISLDWGGLMSIPMTLKDPALCGAVLELLSYESADTTIPAYYDVTLDGKIARDTDSVAMLDIIFDTISYEVGGNYFGFTGGWNTFFYIIPYSVIRDKSNDFASIYKKNEKPVTKTLDRYYSNLEEKETAAADY